MSIFEINDLINVLSTYNLRILNASRFAKTLARYSKDDVKMVYPKNLHASEGNLEVFVFKSDRMLIFINEEDRVTVKALKYQQINKLILHDIKNSNIRSTMEIGFDNNESLNFDAVKDCNTDWRNEYADNIEHIFEILSN
jgi:hypothetical protein